MSEAIYHHTEPGACIATWQNVYLSLWLKPMTLGSLTVARRALALLRTRYRDGYVGLTFIRTGVVTVKVLHDEPLRLGLVALAKELEGGLRAHALVVDGSGFIAGALRSTAAGIGLVARPSYPGKVFDRVDDGVRWLHGQLPRGGPAASARELREVFEGLHARLDRDALAAGLW